MICHTVFGAIWKSRICMGGWHSDSAADEVVEFTRWVAAFEMLYMWRLVCILNWGYENVTTVGQLRSKQALASLTL